MDAAAIHAKIYSGRAKVGARLGLDYVVYRPAQAGNPMANQITTIKAAFNARDNSYKAPNKQGNAFWHGDFDGRLTLPGDYLVGNGKIYYIAAQQHLLPILCVECNRSARVSRAAPEAVGAVGAVGYSGLCDSPTERDDVLGTSGEAFIGWPCSVLFGGRSGPAVGLPGDVRNSGRMILLPPSVRVTIGAGDIVTDDLGNRYAVDGAELSDHGWRISAQEVHA